MERFAGGDLKGHLIKPTQSARQPFYVYHTGRNNLIVVKTVDSTTKKVGPTGASPG